MSVCKDKCVGERVCVCVCVCVCEAEGVGVGVCTCICACMGMACVWVYVRGSFIHVPNMLGQFCSEMQGNGVMQCNAV